MCDRIGIFSDGVMQCVGTSANLKHRFGRGFKLTVNQPATAVVEGSQLEAACLRVDELRAEGGDADVVGCSAPENAVRSGKMRAHEALAAFVLRLAPGTTVLNHLNGTTHFAVPAASLPVETAFLALEGARDALTIDDWGIQVRCNAPAVAGIKASLTQHLTRTPRWKRCSCGSRPPPSHPTK